MSLHAVCVHIYVQSYTYHAYMTDSVLLISDLIQLKHATPGFDCTISYLQWICRSANAGH